MKLNLFTCHNGFLLSAECMLVPHTTTVSYQPVSALVGVVDCNRLPVYLCARTQNDIDFKHYSFVHMPEAVEVGLLSFVEAKPTPPNVVRLV